MKNQKPIFNKTALPVLSQTAAKNFIADSKRYERRKATIQEKACACRALALLEFKYRIKNPHR